MKQMYGCLIISSGQGLDNRTKLATKQSVQYPKVYCVLTTTATARTCISIHNSIMYIEH